MPHYAPPYDTVPYRTVLTELYCVVYIRHRQMIHRTMRHGVVLLWLNRVLCAELVLCTLPCCPARDTFVLRWCGVPSPSGDRFTALLLHRIASAAARLDATGTRFVKPFLRYIYRACFVQVWVVQPTAGQICYHFPLYCSRDLKQSFPHFITITRAATETSSSFLDNLLISNQKYSYFPR